ncbi:MAG: hypothetical protein ACPHID_05440 [Thermoplasmatota archaeon]
MSVMRNLAVTAVATGFLIAGLVFLFPDAQVGAAQVQALNFSTYGDPDGTFANGDETIDLEFSVFIPAGEVVPLSDVTVLLGQHTGNTIAMTNGALGWQLTTPDCILRTDAGFASVLGTSTTGSIEIVSITGATLQSSATFSGYGYNVAPGTDGNGYQTFSQSQGAAVTGSGYGYGSASSDQTATVTIRITGGCLAALESPVGEAHFAAQVFVGSGKVVFPSAPVTASIYADPGTPTTPTSNPADITITSQAERPDANTIKTRSTLKVTGGGADGVDTGTTVTIPDLPSDSPVKSAQATTKKVLKDNTQIVVTTSKEPGTNPFGIPTDQLERRVSGTPVFGFSIEVIDPTPGSSTEAGEYISSLTVTIQVGPHASLPDLATAEKLVFEGFRTDGTPKNVRVSPDDVRDLGGGVYEYDVTLNKFSSYILGTGARISSGGGGGGIPVTETDTTTVTPITQTTTTATATETVTTTNEQTTTTNDGEGAPGAALGLIALALVGAAMIVRRRL